MNSLLQKKQLENMMKEPHPGKRVGIVRLCMLKEERALYGMEQITRAEQAVDMVSPLLMMADRELMVVMSLSVNMEPLAVEVAAVGGLAGCQVDVRNIFKHAVLGNANYVMCFYNHPFGTPEPSQEDCLITERIRQAGEILGMPLVDHIIIGRNGFYSFRENGELEQDKTDYAA